jgi:DNA-binding NarL/FixJ family response regulator
MRTLIVDDHRFFRGTVRRVLEELSLADAIVEAADGDEAVRLVAEQQPDIVLMDCQMPVCDGLEAARRIRRDHPQSKVILFSAFDSELADARQRGLADGYVSKLKLLDQLATQIDSVLSSRPRAPQGERLGERQGERLGVSPPSEPPHPPNELNLPNQRPIQTTDNGQRTTHNGQLTTKNQQRTRRADALPLAAE